MTAVTPELLRRFDVCGPRYTSFPTADRFVGGFGEAHYLKALSERAAHAAARVAPISLYVHVPFCESVCYYCACNKVVTRHHGRAVRYLDYLRREVQLHTQRCGKGLPVSQLHLGGGTPTFLSDDELAGLMQFLGEHFKLDADGEYSIEIDPRTVSRERLARLRQMGFNRLSFGVQDFDAQVQLAVHRVQPAEQVFALVEYARLLGFASINVDLIYGLPRQSPESFAQTLEQVARLRPDRIALYAYAHLPERFKPQRRIVEQELPDANSKVAMLSAAIAGFLGAGYVYVGMDHFALPTDSLAIAKRQGRLHRNFQGYSTQPDCDLIGLGVSAIGKIGAAYSQNAKTLEEYYAAIDAGHLPVQRGLALSRDDLIRRAVIMSIMCQGAVLREAMEQAWLIDFGEYFEAELAELAELQGKGLVRIGSEGFEVTSMGWFFVRAVAMVFDPYLRSARKPAGGCGAQAPTLEPGARFSRII